MRNHWNQTGTMTRLYCNELRDVGAKTPRESHNVTAHTDLSRQTVKATPHVQSKLLFPSPSFNKSQGCSPASPISEGHVIHSWACSSADRARAKNRHSKHRDWNVVDFSRLGRRRRRSDKSRTHTDTRGIGSAIRPDYDVSIRFITRAKCFA